MGGEYSRRMRGCQAALGSRWRRPNARDGPGSPAHRRAAGRARRLARLLRKRPLQPARPVGASTLCSASDHHVQRSLHGGRHRVDFMAVVLMVDTHRESAAPPLEPRHHLAASARTAENARPEVFSSFSRSRSSSAIANTFANPVTWTQHLVLDSLEAGQLERGARSRPETR